MGNLGLGGHRCSLEPEDMIFGDHDAWARRAEEVCQGGGNPTGRAVAFLDVPGFSKVIRSLDSEANLPGFK